MLAAETLRSGRESRLGTSVAAEEEGEGEEEDGADTAPPTGWAMPGAAESVPVAPTLGCG